MLTASQIRQTIYKVVL